MVIHGSFQKFKHAQKHMPISQNSSQQSHITYFVQKSHKNQSISNTITSLTSHNFNQKSFWNQK